MLMGSVKINGDVAFLDGRVFHGSVHTSEVTLFIVEGSSEGYCCCNFSGFQWHPAKIADQIIGLRKLIQLPRMIRSGVIDAL